MSERSVLIIDDDQTLVSALKEGLESLSFRVAAAYDGLQGVMQAHQLKPDIIMLDFNMPAGGGSGVYERLRSSTDTAKTPIVFLTGATVEEVKKTIRSTPNTFFLKKPISIAQLRKVLDKIISANEGGGGAPAAAPPPPAPAPAPTELPGRHKTSPFSGMGTPAEASVQTAPETQGFFNQPLGRPHDDAGNGFVPGQPTPLPLPGTARAQLPAMEAPPPVADPPPAAAPPPAPTPAPVDVESPALGRLNGRVHEFELRVAYADADRLGIVYYANYLRYFEAGRSELLRALGVRYRDLEMERQLFLPSVKSSCDYIGPCRYDDQIRVRTWLHKIGPASISFKYEIVNIEEGTRLAVRGYTRHALLNAYWKPERIPEDIKQKLSAYCVAS